MRLDQQQYDLVNRIKELIVIYPELAEDDILKADMFEGLGLNDALEVLTEFALTAAAMEDAIGARIQMLRERKDRFDRRRENVRSIIETLLTAADTKKVVLPTATLSLSYRKPAPMVVDEAKVPDGYCKFKRSPDMAKIKEGMEGSGNIPGVEMSNGRNVLMIRSV